ncbi:MAG: hypothetical protein HQM09_07375 [Candidatus Riflebacteria bacterium]|nr:hypothetical protein [Candidatus Riflebacteria bacterium]
MGLSSRVGKAISYKKNSQREVSMSNVNLVMSLPNGAVTATSLGMSGLAWHRSPGTSGKFHGQSVLVDLALKEGSPAFQFMDEGGWRDAGADARSALDAIRTGKRTKTALSNGAFNCTPLTAYGHVYLAKSSGHLLEMQPGERLIQFKGHASAENLAPNQVAAVAGLPEIEGRRPRFYLVIGPVEMLVLSNLTPAEYVWYATHRAGKVFRQMMFAELSQQASDLAAREIFETAIKALSETPMKKTKTITQGECFARVPYAWWKGYREDIAGGLYTGDRDGAYLWRFPKEIPHAWDRAN